MSLSLFLGHVRVGTVAGVNLGLCSVNLAEAASNALPLDTMAEIYATAGIGTKLFFPTSLQFLAVSCHPFNPYSAEIDFSRQNQILPPKFYTVHNIGFSC